MKISVLVAVIALASCSSPKYAYYFDHQNNYAGKKQTVVAKEASPLTIDPQMLTASTSDQPILVSQAKTETNLATENFKKTYEGMSKAEQRNVRQLIKKEMKSHKVSKEDAVHATQAGMDHDLKLAIIFGAVGLVSMLIGGNVFWIIGGIALIIGVVFFVKWIIRQ